MARPKPRWVWKRCNVCCEPFVKLVDGMKYHRCPACIVTMGWINEAHSEPSPLTAEQDAELAERRLTCRVLTE